MSTDLPPLPTYEECERTRLAERTPLIRFILNNEPANPTDEADFRDGLSEVIAAARTPLEAEVAELKVSVSNMDRLLKLNADNRAVLEAEIAALRAALIGVRLRANGMYGLLSAIHASGAITNRYGCDNDLAERIKEAIDDHEAAARALIS